MYLKGRNVQGTYTNIVQEHVNFPKARETFSKLLGQRCVSETN